MKKAILILAMGLLWCNVGYAETYELKNCRYVHSKSKSEYPGTINIKINTGSKKINWKSSNDDYDFNYTYGDIQSGFVYVQKPYASDDKRSYADWNFDVKNGTLRVKVYDTTIWNKTPKYNDYPGQFHSMDCDKTYSASSSNQSADISFTIKDKKEQCTVIGFKPNTEKFADCVLRLVELDVKKQYSNQMVSAQNSGNDELAKQLERQSNLQQSQFLMNLGQQLLTPSSPASTMTTCRWAGQFLNCW